MARSDDTREILVKQAPRKLYMQKISITTTGARTDLLTTALLQNVPADAKICLQGDQDFWYNPVAAGATTTITDWSGTFPGVRVLQYQQEEFHLVRSLLDAALDLKACTTSGTVTVWLEV